MQQMQRRQFLRYIGGTAAAALFSGCTSPQSRSNQSDRPPNVIICTCDQLRAFAVGCYGNPAVRTPNIDRLAAEGVRFETAVTNNPACTPARSVILSGQYSRTATGSVVNCGEPSATRKIFPQLTLAERLKDQGYQTAIIGKWHMHARPELVGFDTAFYPNVQHRHYGQTFHTHDDKHFVLEQFSPAYEIENVKQFLKSQTADQPFFLYYNISPPHHPVGPKHMPPEYTEMYDPDKIPMRANTNVDFSKPFTKGGFFEAIKPGDPDNPKTWRQYYDFWFNTYYNSDYFNAWYADTPPVDSVPLPKGFDLRDLTALYYGAVTCVDDRVGELLESLRDNNLESDTIVVFVSDHGDNLGSHGNFNKNILLEESIRIPMILRWPGRIAAGVNDKQIAGLIDLAPTLLDLCGFDVPGGMQGRSLKPMLTQKVDALAGNVAYIETDCGQIGIRTATHLFGMQIDIHTRRIVNESLYFFDLRTDPLQQHNLAGTTEQADIAQDLHRRLLEWHHRTPWMQDNTETKQPGYAYSDK